MVYSAGRLVVTYEALVGGTFRLFVQTARAQDPWTDELFSPAADLGPAPSGSATSIDATAGKVSLSGCAIRLSSLDGGETWSKAYANYPWDGRQLAYTEVAGSPKLAEAWNWPSAGCTEPHETRISYQRQE